jgi:hypothetical protein
MKKPVMIRFANESTYHTTIKLDPKKLKNITKFPNDVFATIDGVRISIRREEYDELIKEK